MEIKIVTLEFKGQSTLDEVYTIQLKTLQDTLNCMVDAPAERLEEIKQDLIECRGIIDNLSDKLYEKRMQQRQELIRNCAIKKMEVI